jgi:hypothetical protein
LINILLHATDADEDFRREAVNNMLTMSSSTIVSSGVLRNIDVSSIFSDPSVSYAYLTMFGNIANDSQMRTQVLDDHSVSICHSPNLDLDARQCSTRSGASLMPSRTSSNSANKIPFRLI